MRIGSFIPHGIFEKKYGPAESEWSIMTREEFMIKEPAAFDLFQNTIPKILSCPSDSMLNIFE